MVWPISLSSAPSLHRSSRHGQEEVNIRYEQRKNQLGLRDRLKNEMKENGPKFAHSLIQQTLCPSLITTFKLGPGYVVTKKSIRAFVDFME